MRSFIWLLASGLAVLGCVSDDAVEVGDAGVPEPRAGFDPGPVSGFNLEYAESACEGFCRLTAAPCDLKAAVVCAGDRTAELATHPDSIEGCTTAGAADCVPVCVDAWRASQHSDTCLGARLREGVCLFSGCALVEWASWGYEDDEYPPACVAARQSVEDACAGAADRGPCTPGTLGSNGNEGEMEPTCLSGGPYFSIDYQARYFDQLLASGLCPSGDDSSQVDLSVLLLSYTREGTVGLLPDDHFTTAGSVKSVADSVTPEAFTFNLPQTADALDPARFQGFVESVDDPGVQVGVTLRGQELSFARAGGEARRADDRLVVLLLDNSGSLKGQPDPTSPVDASKASDRRDERITFLKNLVRLPYLSDDTYFSLVWFDQRQPHITKEFATPTRNRDVLVCPSGADGAACSQDAALDGLSRLERGEIGATPLIDALDQTYKVVVNGDKTRDLNPVVILFTDGTENGDQAASGKSLAEVTKSYAEHTYGGERSPVPVIIVHLQPALQSGFPRGRSQEYQALACATGGEYIFVEDASEFTSSRTLEPLVANRIAGAWKLSVTSAEIEQLPAGPYLLSSDLAVTLGQKAVTTPLTRSADPAGDDQRLFFVK